MVSKPTKLRSVSDTPALSTGRRPVRGWRTLRLRTALLLVVVVAVPTAWVVRSWRDGEIAAWQRQQARLARYEYGGSIDDLILINQYKEHIKNGHKCFICMGYGRPVGELSAVAEAKRRKHERNYRWHAFWAGRHLGLEGGNVL